MKTYIIWIEMDLAKIFKISDNERSRQILRRHEIKHHTNRDPENHKDCEKFFHEIAEAVADASEVLLVGPGLTKEHFRAHLERHHHDTLADKIVGIATMDIVSDAKLLAYSREFFRKYDIFGAVEHVPSAVH